MDHDYLPVPGCGGYGCPSGTPSAAPSLAGPPPTHSPTPGHSRTPSPAPTATVAPGPTSGSLAQTGPSDVFLTSAVIGIGLVAIGACILLALWRRRRTPQS